MSTIQHFRNLALILLLATFFFPGQASACEESWVCSSQGSSGCYYYAESDGFSCYAHSWSNGYCESACSSATQVLPGIC